MQLKRFKLFTRFRGLHDGFEVDFSRPAKSINLIEPVCLVGLNGSGKSNLMQALSEIFSELEVYALNVYTRSSLLAFSMEYKLPVTGRNFIRGVDSTESISTLTWRHIRVTKRPKQDPVFVYWYDGTARMVAEADLAGNLLPNQVFGYSSGMNESISNPFIKMDFRYLEMMRRKMKEVTHPTSQENPIPFNPDPQNIFTLNRLFFLDYNSNAMVILANFLSENPVEKGKKTELDIINDIVGVEDLVSFRIVFNFFAKNEITIKHLMERARTRDASDSSVYEELLKEVEIPPALNIDINTMLECATTVRIHYCPQGDESDTENKRMKMELYFKVDAEMKRAFQDRFRGNATQLFRRLYLLNLLNIDTYSAHTLSEVENGSIEESLRTVLPKIADTEKIFYIDKLRLKKTNGTAISYSRLSDGEHQYIQVAGALKLLDENGSLFLMDEPETHLNPEWRSLLFSTLNTIIKTRIQNDPDGFIPQQEIIVTSHSPFIVSDCQSHQVFIFQRDAVNGKVKTPWHPSINTYGTSVDLLMDEVFSKPETISGLSLSDIAEIRNRDLDTAEAIQKAKEDSRKLGESVEKVFLFNYLIEKEKRLTQN